MSLLLRQIWLDAKVARREKRRRLILRQRKLDGKVAKREWKKMVLL